MRANHTSYRSARGAQRRKVASTSAVVPVLERVLQRAVAAYLALVRDLGLGLEFHHSPNEDAKEHRWINEDSETDEGTQAGWPDFEILLPGDTFFIELKTHKGAASKKQQAVHLRLAKLGYRVYELQARSTMSVVMEVRDILIEHGMTRLPVIGA